LRKMEQNLYMQTATWLVSRELTEAAGPWDTRLLGDDDGEYFCRVLLASDGVRFVPGAKVYYRQAGPGTLSYVGASERKRDAQWLSMALHISYLRSLHDTERVHSACVTFLQNWMVCFYPERLDIFARAQSLARELGGHVGPPSLSWKYSWLKTLFGLSFARKVQLRFQALKWRLVSRFDELLSRLSASPSCHLRPNGE
jgi:hypothetical protein